MNSKSEITKEHNYSFDFIRVTAMLGVILYHAAAAYSYLSPYWPVQDGRNILGDGLRELLVIFIMPSSSLRRVSSSSLPFEMTPC